MSRQVCCHDGCDKLAEIDKDECFLHRISGVGFRFAGGGGTHRQAFHERTNREWMMEHFGTDSERQLGKLGIERRK